MQRDEARAHAEPGQQVAVILRRPLADRIGEAEVLAGEAGTRQHLAQVVAAAQMQHAHTCFSPSSRTIRRASSISSTASLAKSSVPR